MGRIKKTVNEERWETTVWVAVVIFYIVAIMVVK